MKKEGFFTEPYTAPKFFFPPWIGPRYGQPDNIFKGIKILAIGNSHYCLNGNYDPKVGCNCNCKAFIEGLSKDGCSNCNRAIQLRNTKTIDCVSEFKRYKERVCSHQGYMNTYTKFAKILNKGRSGMELEIWDSIAFYNFLQSGVPDKDKQGTDHEILRSKILFIDFLKILHEDIHDRLPDVIIVWGKPNVFSHLPKDDYWEAVGERTGFYHINGNKIKVVCIDHPQVCGYGKGMELISSIAPEIYA